MTERCICHEGVGAFEYCQSGHPDGWIERRAAERQGRDILRNARLAGTQVDPQAYGWPLSEVLAGIMLTERYARNLAAGRAIHDNGDADGNPTIPMTRKRRSAILERIQTPTLEDAAREIAREFREQPEAWPKERREALADDVRQAVRELLAVKS